MVKEAKIIPVIRIVHQIGVGTDSDPIRDGIEYRDLEGHLLFRGDAEERWERHYLPK